MVKLWHGFINTGLQRKALAWTMAFAAGVLVAFVILVYLGGTGPIQIEQYKSADNMVRFSGGTVNILVEGTGKKLCQTATSRWLWTMVNDPIEGSIPVYVPLESGVNALLQPGEHSKFILRLPVPPGIFDGDWFYVAYSVSRCSWIDFPTYLTETSTPTVPVLIKSGQTIIPGPGPEQQHASE